MGQQNITAGDLKWLRSSCSRAWLLELFSVAFFFAMSLLHFYLAALWAGLAGMTLAQAWQGWGNGINSHQQYSGTYLKAMQQFDASGILFAFAIFNLILCFLHRSERQRKARLLAVVTGREQAAA